MKTGIIAGNFDVMHPGYIHMFDECKKNCDRLFVLLHDDPTIERPEKLKPILNLTERRTMIHSVVGDCVILSYNIEKELIFLIRSIDPDVRFLGDDYIGKEFTGKELDTPIHYISRDHGWSTTKFKKAIANEVQRSSNI